MGRGHVEGVTGAVSPLPVAQDSWRRASSEEGQAKGGEGLQTVLGPSDVHRWEDLWRSARETEAQRVRLGQDESGSRRRP